MLWLALLFPEWPLQARFRMRADTRPMAVAQKQRVVALDAAALAQGVRSGQALADALALAPELQIHRRDAGAERQALREAAGCALHYTPHVVLDEEGLLLEVSGSLRLFGGLSGLQRALRQTLTDAGFRLQTAAAPTPQAARWLVRGAPGSVVSDQAGLLDAVASLPIDVIEGHATSIAALHEAGLHTIASVQAVPRTALALRDAEGILKLLDQALGLRADPRSFYTCPPNIDSRIELPVPRHDADVLLFAASRLINAACSLLTAAHAGIEHCRLLLEHEHAPPTLLELRTGTASRDPRRLMQLTREHLARTELPEAASALRLQAREWIALAGRSGDLFGAQAPSQQETREAAAHLVERLRARLGHEAVHCLGACGDHRPEHAQHAVEPGQARAARPLAQRPLWLLPEPELLRECDGQPWRDGPLHCLGRGERIEAGWWDESSPGEALRDYWVAVGPHQEHLWIYREHQPPCRWFLHGVFA